MDSKRFSESSIITLPGCAAEYTLRVPSHNLGEVLSPARISATLPLETLIQRALHQPVASPPLAEMIKPGMRVLVVVDDITRGTPTAAIAPAVLECLLEAGCDAGQVTFAVALGTHRPMTAGEIECKLGPDIPRRFPVVNTPAQQPDAFVDTGQAWDGVPIEVHRAVVEADLVIGIGSVVPHADAGWSGGCKIILPGMCSERTVMENHILGVKHPGNLLGQEETPIRLNMEGVVGKIGLDYVLNVVMTPYGDVIDILGGHFVAAQRAAVQAARPIYCTPFRARADIVVSNAYPAEIDLWQASKGIWAGEMLIKPGGTLILHGTCPEGIGPHPDYLRVMQTAPEAVLAATASGLLADRVIVGGAISIGRMLSYLQLVIVSPGLRDEDFAYGPIKHFTDLQQAVDTHLAQAGPDARLSVITHGGYAYPVPA